MNTYPVFHQHYSQYNTNQAINPSALYAWAGGIDNAVWHLNNMFAQLSNLQVQYSEAIAQAHALMKWLEAVNPDILKDFEEVLKVRERMEETDAVS